MMQKSDIHLSSIHLTPLDSTHPKKLKFDKRSAFQIELRRRVDELFQRSGLPKQDCPQMYVKTVILLASLVVLYGVLVFAVQQWWQAVPLAILLGLVMAAVGFNVQHDGGHQAYSKWPWVNKLMAMTLDLMGGSSYNWRWKHGVLHHTYVNIANHDTDLDIGLFGRLAPSQTWLPVHQYQHYYLWFLYGLIAFRWQLYDDFYALIVGRLVNQPYPRPKGRDLFLFLAGKALFFLLAFGIPLQHHPLWAVISLYCVAMFAMGLVLSIVFQLAHAVEEAEFLLPLSDLEILDRSWADHQLKTTVNFARHNPVVTWLLGGLNFQVEHHLFPQICHIHYPMMSTLVEDTCREFGVVYLQHSSLWAGIVSHFRWLRRMGMLSPADS